MELSGILHKEAIRHLINRSHMTYIANIKYTYPNQGTHQSYLGNFKKIWILGFQSWQVCLSWSVCQFTNPICFTNLISIIVQTKDAILFIINSSRKHLLCGYMKRAMQSVLYLDYLMHLSPQPKRNISVLFPVYKWEKWDSKQASDLINKLAGKSYAADTENQNLFRSLFLILQSGVNTAGWWQLCSMWAFTSQLPPMFLFTISYALPSGEGNGTQLQYSCLENPMDGGAW